METGIEQGMRANVFRASRAGSTALMMSPQVAEKFLEIDRSFREK